MLYIASGKFAHNKKKRVSVLKGAKRIRPFVFQIPWQRKIGRSDEFKSSNKRVRPSSMHGRRKFIRRSSTALLFLSRCSYLVHNHHHHHCSRYCRLERTGDDRREDEIPIKGAKVEHCISHACFDRSFGGNSCSAHLHRWNDIYLASGKQWPVVPNGNFVFCYFKLLVH